MHACEPRSQLWVTGLGSPSTSFFNFGLETHQMSQACYPASPGDLSVFTLALVLQEWISLQPVLLYGVLQIKLRPSCSQGQHSTSELSSQTPLRILLFQEPKLSTARNDSCFEWGVMCGSTYSHNKHNYLVKIQGRWWGCPLSQSRLWSDAEVVTYGPCVTCFYKSTFPGIQQPSLYRYSAFVQTPAECNSCSRYSKTYRV